MIDHTGWNNAKQTSEIIIFKLKVFAKTSINLSRNQELTDHEIELISDIYIKHIGII